MYLGSDGKYHLRLHGCAGQKIVVPQPLSAVLTRRCDECGTAQEFEAAQQGRAQGRGDSPVDPEFDQIVEDTVYGDGA
jgi:hypothetical protein